MSGYSPAQVIPEMAYLNVRCSGDCPQWRPLRLTVVEVNHCELVSSWTVRDVEYDLNGITAPSGLESVQFAHSYASNTGSTVPVTLGNTFDATVVRSFRFALSEESWRAVGRSAANASATVEAPKIPVIGSGAEVTATVDDHIYPWPGYTRSRYISSAKFGEVALHLLAEEALREHTHEVKRRMQLARLCVGDAVDPMRIVSLR